MAVLPIQIARVSNLLQSSVADQSITATQAQLLTVQNELSTGKQVNQPSDNPSAAAMILALQKTLSQQQNYTDNINNAQSQLGVADSTLQSVSDLLTQAQSIASKDVGSLTTQTQRTGDAQVINSLITEAQSLANTNTNGVYIFGGQKSNQPPYVAADGGVQFVGSTDPLQTAVDPTVQLPTELSAQNVFGATSAPITGATNLTPAVTAQTQLSSLAGATGEGFVPATIQISNGTTTKTIDLSSAQTLGDVVSDINAAGVGTVTASLSATGINLSGSLTENITVSEGSGNAAADLGILTAPGGAGAGTPVTGAALKPDVTPFTPLSTLFGGTGLDSSGFIISNGNTSKTITLSAGGDVESLLNSINGAGLGVSAQINSNGTGINVVNTTQGTTVTIGENGGFTATQLGIRTYSPTTPLSELNNGAGVGAAAAGTTGDFNITDTNGTTFTVSTASDTTVQDVINSINAAATAAGSPLTAGFATTGNGLTLTDSSDGSKAISVAPINDSTAAADLGLTAPSATTASSITGADVNGVQTPGVFSDLKALASALQTGNVSAITAVAQNLQADYTNVTNARAIGGAQSDELQNRASELSTANIATQTLLSNVQDTNMTTAISQFQTLQTALQAALETTAQSSTLSLLTYLA